MSSNEKSEGPTRVRASEHGGDADRGEPEFGADQQDELAYRLRQQELIAEFGLFALGASGIGEVMHHATRLAARGMNVDLCKFLEYRQESDDLLVRAGVGWKQGTVGIARLGADFESPAGYAYRTRVSVLSNHLSEESLFRTPRLLAEHGVRRALNVPVMYAGDPYGVLEVDSSNSSKFTTADIAFMQSIANTLSVAIERDVKERELAEALEREALLAAEMRHRVKNVLAVVSALISMARRQAGSDVDELARLMSGRIGALASATDAGLAVRIDASPDNPGVDPMDLTRRVLAPYEDRVTVSGNTRVISSGDATTLALVIHELATNAVKYGALSSPEGHVEIEWDTADARARMRWTERGGPSIGQAPDSPGFGQRMIDRMLRLTDGTIERDWNEDGFAAFVTLG